MADLARGKELFKLGGEASESAFAEEHGATGDAG